MGHTVSSFTKNLRRIHFVSNWDFSLSKVSRFWCASKMVTASGVREPDAYRDGSNRLLDSAAPEIPHTRPGPRCEAIPRTFYFCIPKMPGHGWAGREVAAWRLICP